MCGGFGVLVFFICVYFFLSHITFAGGALKEKSFAFGGWIEVNVKEAAHGCPQQQLEMVRALCLRLGNLKQLTSLHNAPSKVTTALLKILQCEGKWLSEHHHLICAKMAFGGSDIVTVGLVCKHHIKN